VSSALAVLAAVVQATEPLSSQRLGRPYVFMFVAYAIVLGLIACYVVSIAVRLKRVEDRLGG
jgi:CcmD family protein